MLNEFVLPNLAPAYPELLLLTMACVILMVDAFMGAASRALVAALSLLTLFGCAVLTALTATGETTLTFSNMFVDDAFADLLKMLIYGSVAVVFVYSRSFLRDRGLDKAEYYVLVLLATLGMMVMASANHFLTVYLGLELMSLSIYALVAIDRESSRSIEAAMKYFILGSLASGLLLYGLSMMYGATGTLEINGVLQALAMSQANDIVLVFGLVFVVAGFAFKLGVVPFHMWVPDVYHGAITPMTLFISTAPKIATFAMVLRILVFGAIPLAPMWQPMLLIMAVLSIIVGNLAAIAQTNIKRMLAYSGISHMGFMLLALTTGVFNGHAAYALEAYTSAFYYIVAYVLMSLASFGVLLLMSRAGYEVETLEDLKGLNQRSPWYAAMMMFVMFSMAGIPFFIGFFAKLSVLLAVIEAGLIGVAIVAVIFSLIGAFYYLRVVKNMYFDAPSDAAPIVAGTDVRVLLSLNGLAIAGFGLFPGWLMKLCQEALARSLY
ncbi:MAG TPA: NADH-quinone oxidoreductase subunit NuoN [Rhodocyclaceae bacterium]|nr:NADH-quinone oxidoreductase subunit NuoN [Rhodocyclaceae bacterium]